MGARPGGQRRGAAGAPLSGELQLPVGRPQPGHRRQVGRHQLHQHQVSSLRSVRFASTRKPFDTLAQPPPLSVRFDVSPVLGFGGISAFQKKPKQDQNRPLTVPAVEPSNVAPPKPKKFFKSRNVVPSENAALPTSSVAPPEADEAFPSFSKKEEKQTKPQGYGKKSKTDDPDKHEIPKLKIHVERSPKSNKSKFFATKASKKEEYTEKTHLSPNKRYLVRNRDKVINYSEDRGDSPPPVPDVDAPPETSVLKVGTPKTSPAAVALVKPGLMSPTNKDGKPPIVLRISKGTSRLLSTDSEDVLTSPTSDRHSFSEPISEPSETIVREPSPPPKQESLKITIKCYSANKEKPKKAAIEEGDTRVTRASRRNQHKDETPSNAPSASPVPGTDNYELYRTLASPPEETPPPVAQVEPPAIENPQTDDVEMSPPNLEPGEPPESVPPPETQGGRAMRHRQNINYNENAINVIDEITSAKLNKIPAKSYGRKGKKKNEQTEAPAEPIPPSESPPRPEAAAKDERFADAESEPLKVKNNKRQKSTFEFDDVPVEPESETKCKSVEKHEFKSPKRLSDSAAAGEIEDKPSVKLVITKKKGSIFKSRSLVNDGPGAAGKKRHLYKHKWADDVSQRCDNSLKLQI